jgi:hypothetical protein
MSSSSLHVAKTINIIFKRGETYYFSKQFPKDVREHYPRTHLFEKLLIIHRARQIQG